MKMVKINTHITIFTDERESLMYVDFYKGIIRYCFLQKPVFPLQPKSSVWMISRIVIFLRINDKVYVISCSYHFEKQLTLRFFLIRWCGQLNCRLLEHFDKKITNLNGSSKASKKRKIPSHQPESSSGSIPSP